MSFPAYSPLQCTSNTHPVSVAAGVLPTWMQASYGNIPPGIELVIDEGCVAGDLMESINKTVCPHTHSRVK